MEREYYPELERTGIAGHSYSDDERQRLTYEPVVDDKEYAELVDIITHYEVDIGGDVDYVAPSKYNVSPGFFLGWEYKRYNFNELHTTKYAPAEIRSALNTHDEKPYFQLSKEASIVNNLSTLQYKKGYSYEDMRSNPEIVSAVNKLVEYFDRHGYEYFYFDLYMKSDPGLRSRNRHNPEYLTGKRDSRLLPTPANFEDAAAGPNNNRDMSIASNILGLNKPEYINTTSRISGATVLFTYNKYSILTWSKGLLVGTIRQMFGRIPTWGDLGMAKPRYRKNQTLPGFAPSLTYEQLIDGKPVTTRTGRTANISNYMYYSPTYYMLLARIFLGAYDYWDWEDIKMRRYYRIDYLRWIAVVIYMFDKHYIRDLDYDNLVITISTRAIRRRKMMRPVTMPKTREFFGLT